MRIPRYWSRAEAQATTPDGRSVPFHVWRGSRSSAADAQALADEAVGRIADRIQRGAGFPERYAYGDRPLREEVVRELPAGVADADTPDAALTRNVYGAVVLNAARAFFIDVDVQAADTPSRGASSSPAPNPADALWDVVDSLPVPGALKSLFGSLRKAATPPAAPAAPPPPPADLQGAALARLRTWIAAHPEWRVRVYRTHSGLRYLVTHAAFAPTDDGAREAMAALGADPQYVTLCAVQNSFRARLTPKPWRIGMDAPGVTFPYEDPATEASMRRWISDYDHASRGYAAAQFVEEMGGGGEDPDVTAIRILHDEHTRATSGLPLA